MKLDDLEDVNGFTQATSEKIYGLKRKAPGLPYEPGILSSGTQVDPNGGLQLEDGAILSIKLHDKLVINDSGMITTLSGLKRVVSLVPIRFCVVSPNANPGYPFSTGDAEHFSRKSYVLPEGAALAGYSVTCLGSDYGPTNDTFTFFTTGPFSGFEFEKTTPGISTEITFFSLPVDASPFNEPFGLALINGITEAKFTIITFFVSIIYG